MENSGGIQGNITAGLAGRYASALFDLARESNAIDGVQASLATLKAALADSADLAALVSSPIVGRTDAANAIGAVAKAMKLDSLTTKFLGVLADNRRLADLVGMIDAYNRIVAAHRGEVTAKVTSAHPLSAEQLKALAANLKTRVGRDVQIATHVDPAILGGLVVQLGSQLIDGSIRTRLNSFATAMKG
ncbi:F0F1 ATP synthase subunit delta [Sphingopyxis lindanitolerans]|uniref:ATP synthase subunit delta n=1 Tax=Sphingopyxis lindanitolerans TaxID=2054227 RepID=A0A2S8B154_9SPHN|nr:F0F1 ATP synthase subunit delta [Sphingopyxis lindanitolerans]PQM26131.1 F0F1 ATP synthase subunit delta [Sphingopyxis lindanitolerans]